MTEEQSAPKGAKTETITLDRAHVHRRKPRQPGEQITVRPAQARRLKAAKVAH